MKPLAVFIVLTLSLFLSGCSFAYEIVIVNESGTTIEVIYRIKDKASFDEPVTKTLEDWNYSNRIRGLWDKERPWRTLALEQVATDFDTRERIIKIEPHQVVKIEGGHYNPIREKNGDLTDILELRIVSDTGEIVIKGKLLLSQFEKDDYTFIKTYRDELEINN
jgi:hypothetical protein